jgi:hypothetical protein
MFVILTAFSLFHLVAGMASLGLGVRLLTAAETAHWRSKRALLVARLLCWIYPVVAFGCGSAAWRVFASGAAHALPLIMAPFVWLLVMGLIFAIVDFAEDGVIGNTRVRE